MDADGSNVRPLVTGPSRDHKPAWSPDGSQLMIISNRDAKDQAATSFDLYLVNDDGTVAQAPRLLREGDLDSHLVAPVS